MAFFNNNIAYDSQLRRKRSGSTTRERASRPSTSSDEYSRKCSFSTESHESIPPLPLTGISNSTTIVLDTPTLHDFSPTPLPLPVTRQKKRESSPPPFSNLMAYAPHDYSPADLVPWKISNGIPSQASTSTGKSAGSFPNASAELPTRSSSLRRAARLEIHPPKLQLSSIELERTPPVTVPSGTGKSAPPADKSSVNKKVHSHTGSLNVSSSSDSSPVTPMLFAPSHPSSPGHSPTSRSFSSGRHSSRSSLKRALLAAYNSMEHLALPGSSSPVPPYSSIKTGQRNETISPIPAGQSSNSKRHRNVLRKPSVQAHHEHQVSSPTSDADIDKRPAKVARPRAKSVTVSPTRSGAVFDVSQPMPTKGLNLTPAGEVQAAYQESQRRSSNKLHNSGNLIAVGTPDYDHTPTKRSQWIPHSPNSRVAENSAMDAHDHKETGGTKKGITRKISAKWGKSAEKREERHHVVSASAAGFPDMYNPYNESKAFTSSRPIEALVSPRRDMLRLPTDEYEAGQGRVWEDTVDDWAVNAQPGLKKKDKEMDKERSPDEDASNPRRLWRLVKRLSSGSLREKRRVSTQEPPPVPPLPKDLMTSMDYRDENEMLITQSPIPETPKGLMRYISSIPSLTIPQTQHVPTTARWHTSQEAGPTSSSPRSQNGAGSRRLRSETTRSSSPSSGTTAFFSRSRSSSTSSYGETLPPIPDIPLTQTQTIKHNLQGVTMPDASEKDTRHTTPRSHSKSPPRRRSHDTSPGGSATIPWFDVQNPINKFLITKGKRPQFPPLLTNTLSTVERDRKAIGRRPSTANGTTTAPPIPTRSLKRPSTGTTSVPAISTTRKTSVSDVISSPSEGDQRSNLRPRSVSDGVVITDNQRTSPASMTFREMTSLKRPLTEAEKAAKWEDLLSRSAKAGGTLHVVPRTDNSELWSERPVD